MNREESIALFERCEAARRQALDAGKSYDEAHEAAKAVWNAWAEPLIAERKALEEAGKWEVRKLYDGANQHFCLVGKNASSRRLLELSRVEFSFAVVGSNESMMDDESYREIVKDAKKLKSIQISSGSKLDISGFIFPGDAKILSSVFLESTDMKNIEVYGIFSAVGSIYLRNAKFDGSIFANSCDFRNCYFDGKASFRYCMFRERAYFRHAVFENDIHFRRASFSDNAYFRGSFCAGITYYQNSLFSGHADFSNCIFEQDVNFRQVEFAKGAYFKQSVFSGAAKFSESRFSGFSLFQEVLFSRSAEFAAIDAKRTFDLADSRFTAEVPDFTQAHFAEAPRLDNIAVPKGRPLAGPRDKDEASRFQALKRLAIQGHDHVSEQEFFAGELRCRRSDHPKRFELMKAGVVDTGRLFFAGLRREAGWSFPYDFFSAYGRSIWRPLFWLLVSMAFFAWAYLPKTVPAAADASCGTPWYEAAFLSLKNGLLFLGAGQKTDVEAAYRCLYGVGTEAADLSRTVGMLGILQGVVSAVFIFLALLALRNLFKIK